MTLPDGRRKRAVACSFCRKRKIKCDQEAPCSNCRRSGNEDCVYENNQPLSRTQLDESQTTIPESIPMSQDSTPLGRTPSASERTFPYLSTSPVTPSTGTGVCTNLMTCHNAELMALRAETGQLEDRNRTLEERIRQLEGQLSEQTPAPIQGLNLDLEMIMGGIFDIPCERDLPSQCEGIIRCVVDNARFGQSHWAVNGILLIRDIFETIEAHLRESPSSPSSPWSGLGRCKSLARIIKAQRMSSTSSLPTPDLPPKEVADKLIDCYLHTTEAIYRILHVPTFLKDYEALWVSDTTANTAFLAQVKLVLAIGATTYDENFSLRTSAVQWVHESQVWSLEPKLKSQLNIQSLQTNLLLLLARERVGVDGASIWISMDALIRQAICMGLHIDPAPLRQNTVLVVEMHRRLWNTVLELALQSSLTSRGPLLISSRDYNTKPPRNFNDDQLLADDPMPSSADAFTQTSIARALRKTFPQRHIVVKFLNDLASPGTYKETLWFDEELRAAYRDISQTLKACSSSSTQSSPSQFEMQVVDFLMHRYLSALHVPYFGPALHERACNFSRTAVIESSLKIWRAMHPHSDAASDCSDLEQLAICSSGFYRTVTIHAALQIAMELRAQLQNEEGLSPITLRPDLLAVLDEVKDWCFKIHEAGETNVKGYLLMSLIAAQIDGLRRGLGKDEIAKLLIQTVEKVGERCLPILEDMVAAQDQGTNQVSCEGMEELDFLSEFKFDSQGNVDVMSWTYDEINTGSSSVFGNEGLSSR